jgi:hypothetical protein
MLGESRCEWQQGAEEWHDRQQRKIAGAPVSTRLRPEAREFVPASKKIIETRSSSIPLGLGDAVLCDTNDVVVAPAENTVVTMGPANSTESFVGGDEEVVRMLFK